eukprot:TRINITY_DN6063_c0_g5_i1.p3 TRINITY_DN6063_c0_g5~~TRINITY_DN6063_c0_g5_i1.p3  ORF type:complete len:142 (-),score=10.56 TRINITY_DN6063_c0_g5_i1:575-961(-)
MTNQITKSARIFRTSWHPYCTENNEDNETSTETEQQTQQDIDETTASTEGALTETPVDPLQQRLYMLNYSMMLQRALQAQRNKKEVLQERQYYSLSEEQETYPEGTPLADDLWFFKLSVIPELPEKKS